MPKLRLSEIAVPQIRLAVESEEYLTWSASQAEGIGKATRDNGRAGGAFDFCVIHTDRRHQLQITR